MFKEWLVISLIDNNVTTLWAYNNWITLEGASYVVDSPTIYGDFKFIKILREEN